MRSCIHSRTEAMAMVKKIEVIVMDNGQVAVFGPDDKQMPELQGNRAEAAGKIAQWVAGDVPPRATLEERFARLEGRIARADEKTRTFRGDDARKEQWLDWMLADLPRPSGAGGPEPATFGSWLKQRAQQQRDIRPAPAQAACPECGGLSVHKAWCHSVVQAACPHLWDTEGGISRCSICGERQAAPPAQQPRSVCPLCGEEHWSDSPCEQPRQGEGVR